MIFFYRQLRPSEADHLSVHPSTIPASDLILLYYCHAAFVEGLFSLFNASVNLKLLLPALRINSGNLV
jgi:hypothetical protein